MGKSLAVLLAVVVVAELVAIIAIAGALFWLGGTGTIVIGASMLVVALVAGTLALRSMRARS
ncbi:UNVERIFIED_ORG: hypothetical protein E4P37_16325 [Bacillus sp. AZ43]